MKKVSIIIPVYNAEVYIEKCFSMLEKQKYKNLEIIVINDGSTDKSLEILEKISKIQNNVFIYTQENKGIGNARNLGIKKSNGEYLFFLDVDDRIDEECILNLIKETKNSDIVICEEVYDEYNLQKIKKWNIKTTISNSVEYYLTNKISYYVWGKLYKKTLFINNNIFFPENVYFEDTMMNLKLFYFAKNIVFGKGKYYYYQPESSVTKSFSLKKINDRFISINQVKNFLKKQKEYEKNLSGYKLFSINLYLLGSIKTIVKYSKNFDDFKQVINKFKNEQFTFKEIIIDKKIKIKIKILFILLNFFPKYTFELLIRREK
ncbi:MAG: glycosyltransferase family 2 protein [Cetobacterium sp.]